MKYRHQFHAGNFADVHKHVALLALLGALKRKDKGFLYLETHAGRGIYHPGEAGPETDRAFARALSSLESGAPAVEELQHYAATVAGIRARLRDSRAYPGSPLMAAAELRPQDRAVFIELLAQEASTLEHAVGSSAAGIRIECGDGYQRVRAHLPPAERRGLVLIDPPYEDPRDFEKVTAAVADALKRFQTGVIAVWFPIKDQRDTAGWLRTVVRAIDREMLLSELWLYPRDSRVALNGSGMLIVNPPWQIAERMRVWVPQLHALLDATGAGGHDTRMLSHG